MTTAQQVVARTEGFTRLYQAFYEYFIEKIRVDATPYAKYQLQHAAQYFDDLDLQRKVFPLFEQMVATVGEKQAVARAALYDALVAHTFSGHLAAQDAMLHARINELDQATAKMGATLKLLIEEGDKKLQEKIDAISKGKPAVAGPKKGTKE